MRLEKKAGGCFPVRFKTVKSGPQKYQPILWLGRKGERGREMKYGSENHVPAGAYAREGTVNRCDPAGLGKERKESHQEGDKLHQPSRRVGFRGKVYPVTGRSGLA